MNFFGHAVVASWRRPESGFILGSMLPDFATMVRTRPPRGATQAVADGIGFHHETDRVFHASEAFTRLEQAARAELGDLGLHRGARLAVAHVGVEIILDGVLASDAEAAAAFMDALRASDTSLRHAVAWSDPAAARRFESLVRVMRDRLSRGHDRSAEAVAWRIERTLEARPRLALGHGDLQRVERWARAMMPRVAADAPALVDEMRVGLSLGNGAAPRANP